MGNSVLFNGRVCTVFICQLYCHGHPAKICRVFTLHYRLFICFVHLRTLKMTILLFICRLHMVFSSPRHLVVAGGSIILLETVYKMDFSLVGFIICCSILGFGLFKFSSILNLLQFKPYDRCFLSNLPMLFFCSIRLTNTNVCRDIWSNFFRPQPKRFFSQSRYIKRTVGPRSDVTTSNLIYVCSYHA